MALKAKLRVIRSRIPLRAPYHLSFGVLNAFDSFFIELDAQGRQGYGEITPLPGYSSESPQSIISVLSRVHDGMRLRDFVDAHMTSAPMLGSGLTCSRETWEEGEGLAFSKPLERPVPLVGLVDGQTHAELQSIAREMSSHGYRSFKLKAGLYPPDEEASRAKAILEVLPQDAKLSLDANQALDFGRACRLCEKLDGVGAAWLEQPFKYHDWEGHAALIRSTNIPILLDESIWTAEDVVRAHNIGACGVKLKLCKCRGMSGARELIRIAQSLDMVLVFGNGVQTALGNHLEARLQVEFGLQTASEGNGFLKVFDQDMSAGLYEENGCLRDWGVRGLQAMLEAGDEICNCFIQL